MSLSLLDRTFPEEIALLLQACKVFIPSRRTAAAIAVIVNSEGALNCLLARKGYVLFPRWIVTEWSCQMAACACVTGPFTCLPHRLGSSLNRRSRSALRLGFFLAAGRCGPSVFVSTRRRAGLNGEDVAVAMGFESGYRFAYFQTSLPRGDCFDIVARSLAIGISVMYPSYMLSMRLKRWLAMSDDSLYHGRSVHVERARREYHPRDRYRCLRRRS